MCLQFPQPEDWIPVPVFTQWIKIENWNLKLQIETETLFNIQQWRILDSRLLSAELQENHSNIRAFIFDKIFDISISVFMESLSCDR